MKDQFIKISAVEVLEGYSLRLYFYNGTIKEINLEPVLYGVLYEPLRNLELFRQVAVNDETGTIEWPNGADFDPELLYSWDENVAAFTGQMQKIGQFDQKTGKKT
jgi:hypothetical protein